MPTRNTILCYLTFYALVFGLRLISNINIIKQPIATSWLRLAVGHSTKHAEFPHRDNLGVGLKLEHATRTTYMAHATS